MFNVFRVVLSHSLCWVFIVRDGEMDSLDGNLMVSHVSLLFLFRVVGHTRLLSMGSADPWTLVCGPSFFALLLVAVIWLTVQ